MKYVWIFCSMVVLCGFGYNPELFAAPDTLKVYDLDPVSVMATRIHVGEEESPITKDYASQILTQNGFSVIRKGIGLANDLYTDGFKRGDITVVIDGEHYPNSCPNRMDSPITRINPLEMESILLSKTNTSAACGLSGLVTFKRALPREDLRIKAGFTADLGHQENMDGTILLESHQHQVTGRYVYGRGYKTAHGKDFTALYGYTGEPTYQLREITWQGRPGEWQYGGMIAVTTDVMFPYLRMDERENVLWNTFLAYKGHKIYVNRTYHLMNSALRAEAMPMETKATNLTIGLTGAHYDLYYRRWDADNTISGMMMNQPVQINNDLIPNLGRFSANLHHTFDLQPVQISLKLGVTHDQIDENRLPFYKSLYPEASDHRWFIPFAVGLSYTKAVSSRLAGGISAEVASEPPQPEYLYIAVQRPMGKPTWMGRPDLKAPLRATLRLQWTHPHLRFTIFGTHVWDYVNLTSVEHDQQPYMTYRNIDGLMAGFNLQVDWPYLSTNASYIWAENLTQNTPLAEIPPFQVQTTLKSPHYNGMSGFLRHTYADAQTRVDDSLNERVTPHWNRVDAGMAYQTGMVKWSLEVVNLTNAVYYQHLSYLRDPFAAGNIVYEPGRYVRFSIAY